jgi:hypothetical protein
MGCKTFLVASAAALLLCACNAVDGAGKDPDDPDDFDFTPPYTEPKGTVHRGDFFPLTPNIQVPIAGAGNDGGSGQEIIGPALGPPTRGDLGRAFSETCRAPAQSGPHPGGNVPP